MDNGSCVLCVMCGCVLKYSYNVLMRGISYFIFYKITDERIRDTEI